ncbi:MAG: hypothetical protein DMG11_01035 [Acidobacteria bacterium]|nr:MAG: hypothetical protein DMG11_01035 [Acidobacteriota bacterium]
MPSLAAYFASVQIPLSSHISFATTYTSRRPLLLPALLRSKSPSPRTWQRGPPKGTLLIITYDEHGGFYDHVSPLLSGTKQSQCPASTTMECAFLLS